MTDYISRQDAIEAVHEGISMFLDPCDCEEETPMTANDKYLLKVDKAICKRIKKLYAAPVREVKRGRWLDGYCSCCGERTVWDETDYCPNCGADMREDA